MMKQTPPCVAMSNYARDPFRPPDASFPCSDQSLLKLLLADARASEDPTKLPGPLHKALVAEYRRRFGSDAAAAEQLCQLAEQILRECVGVENKQGPMPTFASTVPG